LCGFIASALGVFTPLPYAAETASWAAQGSGQDAVSSFPTPVVTATYDEAAALLLSPLTRPLNRLAV